MFPTKVVEESKTHFVFDNFFFENRAVYEIMWKNIVQLARRQMTIWRMCVAYWMTKATNTHPKYVILIPFPLQQCLHERASVLRYTYIACLVNVGTIWRCIISFMPCRFKPPRRRPRFTWSRRLGGSQSRSGCFGL